MIDEFFVPEIFGDYPLGAEASATSTQPPCKVLRFPHERAHITGIFNEGEVVPFPLPMEEFQPGLKMRTILWKLEMAISREAMLAHAECMAERAEIWR